MITSQHIHCISLPIFLNAVSVEWRRYFHCTLFRIYFLGSLCIPYVGDSKLLFIFRVLLQIFNLKLIFFPILFLSLYISIVSRVFSLLSTTNRSSFFKEHVSFPSQMENQYIFIYYATAKSLQSCPTLCDPIPGILQARTLEWVAITFSNA